VLFKRSDKAVVVALQCSHVQGPRTWFLQREGSGWRDVSSDLVPGYQADAPYVLPRRGTTLQVEGRGALRWTGAGFESN